MQENYNMTPSHYIDIIARGNKHDPTFIPYFKEVFTIDQGSGATPKIELKSAGPGTEVITNTVVISAFKSVLYNQVLSDVYFRATISASNLIANWVANRLVTILSWNQVGILRANPQMSRLPAKLTPDTVAYKVEWAILLKNEDGNLDSLNPFLHPAVLSISFVPFDYTGDWQAADNTVGFLPDGQFAADDKVMV